VLRPELNEVREVGALPLLVQRHEGANDGPVPGAEELDRLLRELVRRFTLLFTFDGEKSYTGRLGRGQEAERVVEAT
jgi:hypothetical protein